MVDARVDGVADDVLVAEVEALVGRGNRLTAWLLAHLAEAHVSDTGRRCGSRRMVEFHHRENWGRGGEHTVENLELRCRAHNQYQAALDYGEAFVERARSHSRAREWEVPPARGPGGVSWMGWGGG